MLKYHGQTLRLLNREPHVVATALHAIAACEARCEQRFPAAIKEWYSLDCAEEALAHHKRACGPNSLDGILKEFESVALHPKADAEPLIYFYGPWDVNTGYEAVVILDGSDDPPVFHEEEKRTPPFSHYLVDLAWWKGSLDGPTPTIMVGGNQPKNFAATFGPEGLQFCNREFEALAGDIKPSFNFGSGFESKFPDLRMFNFFRARWRVEIDVRGDPAESACPAEYYLHADTLQDLLELYGMLWPCHGVSVELWAGEVISVAEMHARFTGRFPSVEVYS